jgi:dTDP-4-amino-4,6-dideoxygalactose transaminase
MISFNKPYITGKEVHYIYDAVATGKISGNGKYTGLCQEFMENTWGFSKVLLTTSCTDALEMAALLIDIKPGDEVIMPSYTFVSTALAFVRQGAKIVFADSRSDRPGIDESKIDELITPKTKAIVPVHYAGVACDMDIIMDIANRHNLYVVEDAAQCIDSYYKGKALGSIGHLGCFSFHETKNLQCGEGGALAINDISFKKRAEIIWEKGTNRAEFFRGEVNKYGWVDIGSSFLPSEITAAFLYAQLEEYNDIQNKRKEIWTNYFDKLSPLFNKGIVKLPVIPDFATNNAHMFYVLCRSIEERTALISFMKSHGIASVFHYLPLHKSSYYLQLSSDDIFELPNCERYAELLVRLPLFYELTPQQIDKVCDNLAYFYE